jgi:hypothetical protein
MLIHCPSCGRAGNLPDRLSSAAHTVRCRKCQAAFVTIPLRSDEDTQNEMPALRRAASEMASRDALFPSELFPTGDEDDEDGLVGDPDDSQYELTAIVRNGIDDSQVELPAFSPDDIPPFEPGAESGFEQASGDVALPDPWYFKFIESWGRYHARVALGFGAASLTVLGYFLVRPLVGGESLTSSTTTLVVGCVGTIAFLLLSVTATAFYVVRVDLGKNVRQLNLQANPRPQSLVNRARDSQPHLSRTAV